MKKLSIWAVAALMMSGSAVSLFAQATASATLQGTVSDKSGAVVPNAEIKILNKETGLARTMNSGEAGNYRFELLPSGIYEVRISMHGFATAAFEKVELSVSRTTTIDATLSPSQQAEVVTVEASGAALVDTQKTDVSRTITPSEVIEIPTNGRDFVSLAVLAPGVRPMPSYDPTKNRIGVFATNGSNGRNVNVTINGIDDKDNTIGGPVMQLPLESILEFNISTQRFSAANGRSEGAAVNVITKSGTNNFHGALYFLDREDAFNSLNYFEKKENGGSGQKGPFSRQQFGGSIGGPVKKDKTFLFFALERSREQTSININGKAFTELTLLKANGFAADPAQTVPTPYFDWRYNGRLDHRFNEKNNLAVSYSNQNNRGLNDQVTSNADLTSGNFTTNQLIIANASLNSVLTPTIVNAATVGYQYWNNLIDTANKVPTFVFPSATFGTNINVPQESFQRKWQFKDDLSIIRGKHSFRMGFDYLYEPSLGGFFVSNPTINLSFFDDASTIVADKVKYPQGFATPGAIQTITDTSGNPYFLLSAKMFGTYFQDDWKVSRNVTINLGLRWDKDINLNGGSAQSGARAYQLLKAIGSPYASRLPKDDNKDFSPRFGIAWDVTGGGKHVVRAGYGIYYGQTFENIPLFMLQQTNPTLFTTVQISNGATPGSACTAATSAALPSGQLLCAFRYGVDPNPPKPAAATQLANGATGQIVNPLYRNPYTQQWNGGYSWSVTPNSVIEVEYVHVLGLHESKRIVINPTIGGVRNTDASLRALGLPAVGQIRDNQPIGRSRYDGLNVSYRRRLSHHFSFNTNYVLSQSLGYNGSSAAFSNGPTDLNNIFASHDFGYTTADERHRWVANGIVDLPFGIKLAPVMQWASGRAYTSLEGVNDTYAYGGGQGNTHTIVLNSAPDDLLATKAFSAAQLRTCLADNTCHQTPFGNLRGNPFFELDMRVSKNIKFGERANLELIFQAFDLTNRANFGVQYQTSARSTQFRLPTGFIAAGGVLTPKSFSGEFGARFSF